MKHWRVACSYVCLLGALIVLLAAGACSRETSFTAQVTAVDGQRVCLLPIDDAGRSERCLVAGVELTEGEVIGQAPDWYLSHVGQCVQVVRVADGPWGRVTEITDCPSGVDLDLRPQDSRLPQATSKSAIVEP